jgi:DNA-directed RNA polymerase specialized sigma24 family protein
MDLVTAAREGSEAAFLQLFDEHRLPLFRFAFRMTGSVADAEDVVQECLRPYGPTFSAWFETNRSNGSGRV